MFRKPLVCVIYDTINRYLDSCVTLPQTAVIGKMTYQLLVMYPESQLASDMYDDLRIKLRQKRKDICKNTSTQCTKPKES
jgi:hypothetical protein